MNVLQFVTAIPWGVSKGSGCYVGARTLIKALRGRGLRVAVVRPGIITPVYTATRLLFNESLRWRRFNSAATIGIDADGYAISRRRNAPPHIACIKGVLGDVSGTDADSRMWILDGINNPGFSGGPVILGTGDDLKFAAVISGYYLEPTEVIRGGRADLAPDAHRDIVNVNSGFIIAHDIVYAVDAIKKHPTGPIRPIK